MSWYEDGAHFHNFDARPDPSQLRTLVEKLQPHQDESTQFDALSSLCHILSMATEETLSNFSAESYLPLLAQLLNAEHNPNIMLLACRTLTHMMDVIPQTIPLVLKNHVHAALCEKLLNIEYIDLAEQSILAISKIAAESPNALIHTGVLTACLSYVDFFPVSVQRISSSIVANCCRQIPKDEFELISDSLALISNLLHSTDSKILENACLSYSRVVECFHDDASVMLRITSTGVISNFMNLLTTPSSSQTLSPVAFIHVIRTLAFFANSSSDSTISLLSEGISFVLRNMINSIIGDAPGGGSTPSKSSEQMFDILVLCDQLLPPLPQADDGMSSPKPLTQLLRSERSSTTQDNDERRIAICQHPGLICQFAENLFSPMMKAFGMNVNGSIRYKCLSIMLKIITFSSSESLAALLMDIPISSFLASLLVLKEWNIVLLALKMADNLMQKLSSIFSVYFEKEGVFYEVQMLASSSEKDSSSEREDSSEENQSAIPVTPKKGGNKSSVVKKAFQLHQTFCKIRSTDQGQGSTSCLSVLSEIAEKLKCSVDCPIQDLEPTIITPLQHALDLILERMTVSAHEVSRSGFVEGLTDFLTLTRNSSLESQAHRKKRAELFINMTKESIQEMSDEASSKVDRLSSLIRKVNEVVSKEERFMVFTNDFPANEAGFRILSKPFRLKFIKASPTSELSDCPQSSVMIDPFAPIQSIDDFLWPLVYQKEAGESSSRPARRGSRQPKSTPSSDHERHGSQRQGNLFSALAMDDGDHEENPETPQPEVLFQNQTQELATESAEAAQKHESRGMPADGQGGHRDGDEDDDVEEDGDQQEDHEHHEDEGEEENEEDEGHSDEPPGGNDAGQDTEHENAFQRAKEARKALEALRKARQAYKGREQRDSRNEEEIVYDIDPASTQNSPQEEVAPKSTENSLPPVLAHLNKKRKLAIYLHDPETNRRSELLPQYVSFLHALQQFYLKEREENPDSFSVLSYWSENHTIAYEMYKEEEKEKETSKSAVGSSAFNTTEGFEAGLERVLSQFGSKELISPSFSSSIKLLSVLKYLNSSWTLLSEKIEHGNKHAHLVPDVEFHNISLSAKLNRQLQDLLSVSSLTYPQWNHDFVPDYAFLFPFEIRRELLLSTAFGTGRALQQFWKRTQQSGQHEGKEFRPARVTRQKVRVSRDRILSAAVKIMNMFGSSRLMIEVQYADEVGIGSGPTAEFYTLVSRELRKKSHNLWLDFSGKETEYISNPKGLFPRPFLPGTEPTHSIEQYRFMGMFMAKALMDSRILDLPLSMAFYQLFFGTRLSVTDVYDIDESLGNLLSAAQTAAMQKSAIKSNPNYDEATKAKLMKEIKMFGEEISSLSLEFTFPGLPELELKVGGANLVVDYTNIDEYYESLMDLLSGPGIQQQLDAFRAGFEKVIPLRHLRLFTPVEVDIMMNGVTTQWDLQSLSENLKCDHGYSLGHGAVQHFISILTEMSAHEQMSFVTFVTGSPKLPLGGLASLNPKLTIVKKLPEPGQSADGMLPSVSTCFHYVKLPDYSSKEVMKQRLVQAIQEGQGNFHLS